MLRALLLLIVVLAVPAAAAESADLPEEDRALIAWFDGLEYPVLKGRKFVRVSEGVTMWTDEVPVTTYVRGFLLEDDGQSFRVLITTLRERTFERSAPGVPLAERIDFEIVDADDALDEWLLGGPPPAEQREWWCYGWGLSARARIFVIVRWAAAQRSASKADAHDRLALVRRLRSRADPHGDSRSLLERLREELSRSAGAARHGHRTSDISRRTCSS